MQVTYQDDRFIPNTGFPLRPDGDDFKAPDIRRSLFVGVPNEDIDDAESTALIGSMQLDQQLGARWLAKLRLNYSESKSEIAQDSYAYKFLDGGDTYLYAGFNRQNFDSWAGELNLDGSFDLLGRTHQILLGAEINQVDRDRDRSYVYLGVANIYDQNFADFPSVASDLTGSRTEQQKNNAVFFQTVLNPHERTKIVLGGRYDRTETQSHDLLDPDPNTNTDQTRDQAFTGRLGLIYDVTRNVSAYGTYAQSFLPTLAESVSGILEPETGELLEVGLKAEFFDDKLAANLAIFRLDRDDVPIRDPGNRDSSISAGLQRAEGVELELNGELLPGWNISAAGTYLDAEFIERDDPNFGFRPATTSEWQGSLFTTYEPQSGPLVDFGFGVGVFAVGQRQLENDSDATIAGYERIDLTASYKGFENVLVSVLVRNVFDERYVEVAPDQLFRNFFGSPRAFLLRVNYAFD